VNVNDYLARSYPLPPCWALVADVYTHELDQPVHEYRTITDSVRAIAATFRLELHKAAHGFRQALAPQDMDVVLLGRSVELGVHHAGVYWQGSVLHALPTGNYFQDLASLRDQYQLVEFWRR